jgi:hypothetical protein
VRAVDRAVVPRTLQCGLDWGPNMVQTESNLVTGHIAWTSVSAVWAKPDMPSATMLSTQGYVRLKIVFLNR